MIAGVTFPCSSFLVPLSTLTRGNVAFFFNPRPAMWQCWEPKKKKNCGNVETKWLTYVRLIVNIISFQIFYFHFPSVLRPFQFQTDYFYVKPRYLHFILVYSLMQARFYTLSYTNYYGFVTCFLAVKP